MRKSFLLFSMYILTISSNAAVRSIEELKILAIDILSQGQKAKGQVPSTVKMVVFSETDDIAVVGATGSGFVILAKDDNHEAVLGYSDSDYKDAADNRDMQWWLECMTKSLANGRVSKEKKPDGVADAVEPFITTHWNRMRHTTISVRAIQPTVV